MKLRVLKEGEGYKIVLEDMDYSVGDVIRHELVRRGTLAGLSQPHLLERNFVIYTKAGKDEIEKAIEEAMRIVEELREKGKKALKLNVE